MPVVAFFLALVLAYGLVSRRLRGTLVSAPMVFAGTGLILGLWLFTVTDLDTDTFLVLGEVALAMTLFSDAARMNPRLLRDNSLPVRMLGIGLPLTIAAGAALAVVFFSDLSIWEAAILGTVLAPTDAGLGKEIVASPKVPARVRQTLNVEAGLNDGIAVPFLLLFIAGAEAEGVTGPADVWQTFAQEIGFALIVGVLVGFIGGSLFKSAMRRDWLTATYKSLIFPAMAIIAFIAADQLGGSGFISAFIGGLTAAGVLGRVGKTEVGFIESQGQLLTLAVFFIFGAVAASVLPAIDLPTVVYAVLSLTIVRMVPVAIALARQHLNRKTVLFLGWFGPRGLASIVLGLLVVSDIPQLGGLDRIQQVVTVTVMMSIFAHGLSTNPLINVYGRQVAGLKPDATEKQESGELPTREAA